MRAGAVAGRAWETPTGNLAASLMIVPDCDPAIAATLGFVAGVALNRALAATLPAGIVRQGLDGAARVALKWPNDVLADGAKLAGILLEAQKRPDGRHAVVIGFGVNIVSAPSGLPYPATSLNGLGADISAETIFSALAEEWVVAYELWDHGQNARPTSSASGGRRPPASAPKWLSAAMAAWCAACSRASMIPGG